MTEVNLMKPYFTLMQDVLDNGEVVTNARTGEKCWFKTNVSLNMDLSEGYFPANTRKKVGIKGPVGELLGFFRGYTNAEDFERVGTKVWYANANQTQAWLDNPFRKGENDNGAIYPFKTWEDIRIATTKEEADRLALLGFACVIEGKEGSWVMRREIDQLDNLIKGLLEDPTSRRHMVTANDIRQFDFASLNPCHHTYTFTYLPDGRLDLECAMRSWDMGLAYNLQLSSIFLHVVARLVGMKANKLTLHATNCHLYESGLEAAKTMLSRADFPSPTIQLSDAIQPVTLDNYKGALERIEPEHIWLDGYQSHPAIKTKMVA